MLLQNLHAEHFNDVLRMLPSAYFLIIGTTCSTLHNACKSTAVALGYTAANDGLRTAYLLEAIFGIPPDSVYQVMHHVVLGEGQWVMWGDDPPLRTLALLADFWTTPEVTEVTNLPAGCNLCEPCQNASFHTRHRYFMR